jgi:hypothetical protein
MSALFHSTPSCRSLHLVHTHFCGLHIPRCSILWPICCFSRHPCSDFGPRLLYRIVHNSCCIPTLPIAYITVQLCYLIVYGDCVMIHFVGSRYGIHTDLHAHTNTNIRDASRHCSKLSYHLVITRHAPLSPNPRNINNHIRILEYQ